MSHGVGAADAPRSPAAPGFSRGWLVAALLLHLLPFATRPALIGGDEPHYALAAHSLATDGDLDLADDYAEVEAGSHAAGRKRAGQALDRHLLPAGDRQVFAHPVGLPVLAAPLLVVWRWISGGAPPDLPLGLLSLAMTFAALLAGWRLLRDHLVRGTPGAEHRAAWMVFALYFASPLWFYSRTFFTEPYTWAFAVLAVDALAHERPLRASLFLALALAMKETALLLVGPIWLVALMRCGWPFALRAAVGPVVFAALFVAKNLWLVGRPLATFQTFQWGDPLAGGVGLLASPERGLLWFAPLLLLALVGFARPGKSADERWVWGGALLVFGGYLALSASWVDWRGGDSYATRLLLPALPALAIPLVRLAPRFPGSSGAWLLGGLASLGFAVQLCAAVDPVPALWGPSVFELVGRQPAAFGVGLLVAIVVPWRAHHRGFGPPHRI